MYLAVNPPHQITILGGVLLLPASQILSQLLNCTGIPPRLLIHFYGTQIRGLFLFWKLLIP